MAGSALYYVLEQDAGSTVLLSISLSTDMSPTIIATGKQPVGRYRNATRLQAAPQSALSEAPKAILCTTLFVCMPVGIGR